MNKLVAVMNKSLDSGIVMNALAHISLGLGASLGVSQAELVNYTSQDGVKLNNISKMPYIILRATGGKIKTLYEKATADGIQCIVFTETMTGGTWEEQIEKTASCPFEQLVFYGIALIGPQDIVTELTKKFSLWK